MNIIYQLMGGRGTQKRGEHTFEIFLSSIQAGGRNTKYLVEGALKKETDALMTMLGTSK